MHAVHRSAPPLAILIALSALAVLPLNMIVPSLPGIARDLGSDFATANVAVAGYVVVTAFVHLAAGALSDRFGRRPVLLTALLLFTGASIGCGMATDIRVFLFCRLLQAVVIAGFAVSLAAIRDVSGAQVASRIGYVSSAWALAPMIGPTVGGALDGWFGWRANFAVFALLGVAVFCLSARCLPETNHHRATSLAQQWAGYGALIRSSRFRAYAFCMACSSGTLYIFLGAAPLVARQMGETSPTMLGVYMGLLPAAFMAGSYAVGRRGARESAVRLILAGRTLTCLGLAAGIVLAWAGFAHPLAFFGPCLCIGLGNGLTLPTAQARILSLHAGLAGTASGLASAITMIGAGGIAFVAGFLIDTSNARLAALVAMLAASLVSLVAVARIAGMEGTRGQCA